LTMPAVGFSGESASATVKRTTQQQNNTSYAYAGFNEGGVTGEAAAAESQPASIGVSPVTIKLTISNGSAQASSVVTTNAGNTGALSTVGSGTGGNNLSYSSSASYTTSGGGHVSTEQTASQQYSSTGNSTQFSSSYSSNTTYTKQTTSSQRTVQQSSSSSTTSNVQQSSSSGPRYNIEYERRGFDEVDASQLDADQVIEKLLKQK